MSSRLEADAAFEATIPGLLYRQFTQPKLPPAGVRLDGQVAIITGSNVGLGLSASRQLLQLKLSHLVMAVRSKAKGDAAAKQLRDEFPDARINVWILDMESYGSIQDFVKQCATLPRIDFAILNAGLMKTTYTVVPDTGHEMTMQVNYLSTALLSILLLPVLKSKKTAASKPPVLSIVGSDTMYRRTVETNGAILPQFDQSTGYEFFAWYGKSKLLLAFFVARLAQFVDPQDVLINISNPGATKGTAFGRDTSPIFQRLAGVLQFFFARTVESGASTYVDAVLSKGEESHGSFVSDWAIKPYAAIWYTDAGRTLDKRLWEETMEELNFVGASKILEGLKTS